MPHHVAVPYANATVYFCGWQQAAALSSQHPSSLVIDLTKGVDKASVCHIDAGKVLAANKHQWFEAGLVASDVRDVLNHGTTVIVHCNLGAERTALVAARFYMLTREKSALETKAWIDQEFGQRNDIDFAKYPYVHEYLDAYARGAF